MSNSRYVAGLRAVEQLLQSKKSSDVRRVYAEYQTSNPRVEAAIKMAQAAGVEVQPANRARLTQMSGEARHQGIVAELRRSTSLDEADLRSKVEERLQDADATPLLLLILDGVQDPHNLGACLRTADAAGVDAVIVPRHAAAGLGPTVSKVAAGAAEQIPFAQVGNLNRVIGWLRDYGVQVIGTSDKADGSVFEAEANGHAALVMGREETGLSQSIAAKCSTLVSIPMAGSVSSLNVSVATGVCLYEIVRQRALREG